MPPTKEILVVNIRTTPDGCDADTFVAKRGSTVIFDFPEFRDFPQFRDAKLVFKKPAPFPNGPEPESADEIRLRPGQHRVKDDAPFGKLRYDVTWIGGGKGNGNGEIIP
jgi:hypothetical protein